MVLYFIMAPPGGGILICILDPIASIPFLTVRRKSNLNNVALPAVQNGKHSKKNQFYSFQATIIAV